MGRERPANKMHMTREEESLSPQVPMRSARFRIPFLTALFLGCAALLPAWTPSLFVNSSDNTWNLFWPAAEGDLAVTYTDNQGHSEDEFTIQAGALVDLDLEPGEFVSIRLLDETLAARQRFSFMDPQMNVVSRLTLAPAPAGGNQALAWDDEAQDGPHPGAPDYYFAAHSPSILSVHTQPIPMVEDAPEEALDPADHATAPAA